MNNYEIEYEQNSHFSIAPILRFPVADHLERRLWIEDWREPIATIIMITKARRR